MNMTRLATLAMAAAAVLLFGTGTAVAGSKQDGKPPQETASEKGKQDENKVLRKKRMHEERKAAASRFQAAKESGDAKAAKKK